MPTQYNLPTLRSSSYPRRENIIHIPKGTYGLISALQAATKTLQQQQQNDDNNPTLEHSIQLGVPTRDPALDKEQIENNGLDDIKILPQWRQFVGALRSYNPEDQIWCFERVQMSSLLLNMLLPVMKSRNVHTLEFNGKSGDSNQKRVTCQFLCDILESNTNIKRLILRQSTRFTSNLYKAIENHPSLEELHITNMGIGTKEGLLRKILNTSRRVKYLNLNRTIIVAADTEAQGGMEISQLLKYDHSLEHLNLSNTGLTNDDVVLIADALKFDTKLRVLSLGGKKGRKERCTNEIASRGRKALSEVLFNASSLDSVANSNHTCRVDIASDLHLHTSLDPCFHEDLLNILNKGSPKDNRRWKVLSVLYATSGLGIGDEFETYQNLKVIPELLAFVTASFEDENLPTDETILVGDEVAHVNLGPHGDVLDKLFGGLSDENGASSASNIFPRLSPLFPEETEDNSGDELSVESDESFDSYDSELEDLDDAFEEEEDEVYESFDKSFLDPAFCGERARLTIMFQVVQKWGLPLLDKTPPLPEQPVAAGEDGKQKRKRSTSWKCEPGKKGKKTSRMSLKKGSKEVVISQREIDSLLS